MKQKGFTLIELLAVIVILAIIAIIAVPVILNVIEKSKIGAAEQSAQGYIDAVEKQIVTNKVKNENLIEEGEYTKAELDEKNVKIKGEITDATVVVGAKGRVTQGRFCINGYSIDYDGKKTTKNTEANYCNVMNSISDPCLAKVGEEYNFDYTGNVQEFTAECEGKYKLEVWGAQGGSNAGGIGGYGAYSYGIMNLELEAKLYIVVGGQGIACVDDNCNGGYNGGGRSWKDNSTNSTSSGGGATHIATRSGLLSTLSSYRSDILIVAGAGGGGGHGYSGSGDSWNYNYNGGAGGGYTGNCGIQGSGVGTCGGTGGNQSSGGTSVSNGGGTRVDASFGQGAYKSNYNGSGYEQCGGGGGFYGGGLGIYIGAGGAGGSGYIGNSSLTDKGMYCYNCSTSNDDVTKTMSTTNVSETPTGNYAKQGNGYARITYLGE